MSRHAFLGTNQFSAKYTGDYDAEWEDFRKSVVSTIEASMFGFSMSGGDVCGSNGIADSDLCENWVRAGAMSPMMRLIFDGPENENVRPQPEERPSFLQPPFLKGSAFLFSRRNS